MELLVWGIAAGIINGMFWFIYSMTGNIVGSMSINAGAYISVTVILYMLGQRILKWWWSLAPLRGHEVLSLECKTKLRTFAPLTHCLQSPVPQSSMGFIITSGRFG